MKKDKVKTVGKKFEVMDALKCFFFLVLSIVGVSVVLQLVLLGVAWGSQESYENILNSDIVSIINYALTPTVFIVFFLVYTYGRGFKPKEALSDGKPISLLPISIAIVLGIICIFLFTPFMNLIDYLFSTWGYLADNTLPLQAKMSKDFGFFLLGILVFALLPAVAEELIFRGIIQKGFSSKFSNGVTIVLTTALFVLLHGSLQQTVYQFLVGVMLGYIALVGGNILYSIILHFINNALVVILSCFDIVSYLSPSETIYYNIFSMIFPFLIFLLGLVLVGILFWVLKYLRNKNFFRYEAKKVNKYKKTDKNGVAIVEEVEEKIGFAGVWKNLHYNEKIFLLANLIMVGLLWLINTISGFMG